MAVKYPPFFIPLNIKKAITKDGFSFIAFGELTLQVFCISISFFTIGSAYKPPLIV